MKTLAANAGRDYSDPWDAMKIWGCHCDIGYRGPDCSLRVSCVVGSTFCSFNLFSVLRSVHHDLILLEALAMNLVESVQVVALVIMRLVCVVVILDFMAMHAVNNQCYFKTKICGTVINENNCKSSVSLCERLRKNRYKL